MTAIKPVSCCLCVLILSLILCSTANAAPEITSWSNSITSDNDVYPTPNNGQTITCTAGADETIVTWTWCIDGVLQSNNYDNISTSFTAPFHHNISVTGTNAGGTTQMITWYPIVYREMATEYTDQINESAYGDILTSMEGETDFELFLEASLMPYVIVLGKLFFLLIFGAYFGMLWIRQEKSVIPIVLGFSVGGLLIGFISEDFAQMAVLFIIMGAMGILYSVYRER